MVDKWLIDTAPITCVILSRSRLGFLKKSVHSAASQTKRFKKIIVSDSTPHLDETEKSQLRMQVSESSVGCPVDVIFRDPSKHFADNWAQNLEIVDTPWVVFLHDDDLLLPQYVQVISGYLSKKRSDIVAVAPNADIINKAGRILGGYRKRGGFQRVEARETLLKAYFFSLTSRPPPFPSYCYRTTALNNCPFIDIGRLSDVLFLLNLSELGVIEWLPEVLFQYRFQSDQDTHAINLSDLSQFVVESRKTWSRVRRAAFFTWLAIRLFRARILHLLQLRHPSI